jgi:hypothetical protein
MVDKKTSTNEGDKGMLSLDCHPLRGREGVTIPTVAENERMTGKI